MKKKRILTAFLLLCTLFMLILPAAAEETAAQKYAISNGIKFDSQSWKDDEELLLSEQEDGTLMVMGPRKEAPERIEIPSEICGRRISGIAPKAFFACSSLLTLNMGSGVREIGESAFFGCRSLSSVSFERGLERVGDSAFAGCENLYSLVIHNGLTSIGKGAFEDCIGMTSIVIPSTITEIGDGAFYGCANFGIVYYRGSEDEWKKITIGSYNGKLTGAEVEYNYKEYEPEEENKENEGNEENT